MFQLRASHKTPVNRVAVHDDAVFLIVLLRHDCDNCVATRREFFLVRALHFGGHQWFLSVMQNVVGCIKAIQKRKELTLCACFNIALWYVLRGAGLRSQ